MARDFGFEQQNDGSGFTEPPGTPFRVWAEMPDGTQKVMILYGIGASYIARVNSAVAKAKQHPDFKGAREIRVVG